MCHVHFRLERSRQESQQEETLPAMNQRAWSRDVRDLWQRDRSGGGQRQETATGDPGDLGEGSLCKTREVKRLRQASEANLFASQPPESYQNCPDFKSPLL